MIEHVIWTNEGLDYDDWYDDLASEYPDLSDEERLDMMYELNGEYLGDERMNLNVPVARKIVVLGDLGLWDGRHVAYRFVDVKTIGELLDCGEYDYVTWYVDEFGDLCRRGVHHDGVNVEVFRMLKQDVDEDDVADKMALCSSSGHKATREAVREVSERLGEKIAEVYGWKLAV